MGFLSKRSKEFSDAYRAIIVVPCFRSLLASKPLLVAAWEVQASRTDLGDFGQASHDRVFVLGCGGSGPCFVSI